MAIIEYLKDEHPGGFIGLRVATTLGTHTLYRQIYLSYSDYSPSRARTIAKRINSRWREEAEERIRLGWISDDKPRRSPKTLATGLRCHLIFEYKQRAGRTKQYVSPSFVVDGYPRSKNRSPTAFRFNASRSISLDEAYHKAVRHYASLRGLDDDQQAYLLAKKPAPAIFVQMAISEGLKDRPIDVNDIRRRVGVPEL